MGRRGNGEEAGRGERAGDGGKEAGAGEGEMGGAGSEEERVRGAAQCACRLAR